MANRIDTLYRLLGTEKASKKATRLGSSLGQVTNQSVALTKQAGKMRGEFVQVAGAFTALLVARQVRNALFGVATIADQVTLGMSRIRAVAGELGDAGDVLEKKMLSVGATVGKSFTEIAETTRNLLAQSLSPTQVLRLLEPLEKFQVAGEVTSDQATNLVVALTNMGIGSADVAAALDTMKSVGDATALTMTDFTKIMTKVGPTASAIGLNFNQVVQSAALLRRGFEGGATEATAFNRGLIKLIDPTRLGKLKAAFGVDVVDQATGGFRDLNEIIFDLSKAMDGTVATTGKLTKIFGEKTAPLLLAGVTAFKEGFNLAGQEMLKGEELLNAFRQQTLNTSGAVNESFNFAMQNMAAQVERISAGFQNLVAVIGEQFAGKISFAIELMADFVNKIREFLSANPAIASMVGFVAELAGAFALSVAALLSFAGVVGLTQFAIGFLNSSLPPLLAGLAGMVPAATAAASRFRFLAGEMGILRASTGFLKTAFGGLFRAILGPFGLILTVFELIPFIGRALGIGRDDTKQVANNVANQAAVAQNLGTTSQAFKGISDRLGEIIDEFTGKTIKKFPVLDESVVGVLGNVLDKAGDLDKTLRPEALSNLGLQVRTLFDVAKQGGEISPMMFDRAAIALQTAIGFASEQVTRNVPGAEKRQKALTETLDNLRLSVSEPVAIQRERIAALRAKGGDIFTSSEGGIVTIPKPPPGAPAETGLDPASLAESKRKFDRLFKTPEKSALLRALGGSTGSVQRLQALQSEFPNARFAGEFTIEIGPGGSGTLRNAAQQDAARSQEPDGG